MSNNVFVNNYNKTPNNSCWLWSSLRIANNYVHYKETPKELHNDIIKQYLNNETINIDKYDEDITKEADIDKNLCGNAVEFLTLNGFYYDFCIPIKRNINDGKGLFEILYLSNYEKMFAILIQLPGHYECIIKNNNEYYRYSQTTDKDTNIIKLPIINNLLPISINRIFTNLYIYTL